MSKNLKITSLILILILLGAYIFYYSFWTKSPPSLTNESRDAKLIEMSQSLTTPKQTPQFKAKLEEMSKSLSK